ncbi:MAG: NGG1p interacting factor 3 protein, NIF3 [Candidatus Daviesbacteria bacterium GW2011_GWA1_41_61]|uniref:NGG1p interacting factor 3 protein, NIF3 n=1 Tax=Candidatus Daviesbacteria bacterium GW2011_GWA2_40_9 TaxID=1618424 RepID=A0A0G0WH45_9BACT|nr:MAG: NGG1p interacting factor 3 protein, NIF3 [Candidatus Daviesbacteria bacterium GW2011_GWC1_40_9]KKR83640.1 MAG: NGG1p interacting factor 3 protein, NIF3 [Candidatus Daviesbacteria bacterium GW2011_GWA2_40_9]KKR92701.1 MAG: NGG1p interacting factor 3 protein, NIF3 [Candidatus Daviesbacteria bacterium GW2011_GWB1_41_15]KKS14632.1 MAG: NGG1p interacting factor 3 protein, NIF3 [Candidatus Daviesbacteria bacterium GW2011_GWA1_41_61]
MNKTVKIVVFVPKTHTDIVRQAIGGAGAGKIGLYSHCSYSVDGIGRYKPMEGAHPAIGEIGKFEQVQEERIECVSDQKKAKAVIAAIRKVHPYEEVAFDIYPLISEEEL